MNNLTPFDFGGGNNPPIDTAASLLAQNERNIDANERGAHARGSRVTANRNLSQLFSQTTFGDPLIANIFGSDAVVRMSDPIDSAMFAVNMQPYTFDAGMAEETVTATAPTTETSVWEKLTGLLKGILIANSAGINPTNVSIPSVGDLQETARVGFKYSLLALVAIVLLIFGLYLLVKDSIPKVISIPA